MERKVTCKRCNTETKPESKCNCFVSTGGQSGDNQERHHRFSQIFRKFAQRFKHFSSSNESTNVYSMNVKPSGTGSAETHPRKRALLCGVTYNKKKYMLKGTVNDVKSMREFLISQYGYPEECIRVLTGNYQLLFVYMIWILVLLHTYNIYACMPSTSFLNFNTNICTTISSIVSFGCLFLLLCDCSHVYWSLHSLWSFRTMQEYRNKPTRTATNTI